MKRFLTLFMVLLLTLMAMAIVSCGGGNDTDTSTDTNTDTDSSVDTNVDTSVDSNVKKEATYVITIKDQDGNAVANAKMLILNEYDEEIELLTTDADGKATITLSTKESYFVDVSELPEGYLDVAGKTRLENEDATIQVENNIPNGTLARPYPVEDVNNIKLGANEVVYYVSYGGDRNLLIENAQGLRLTYGSEEPKEADSEGKISFKMPASEDLYDRATKIKLENTTGEEKAFALTIYSDKGALDNPYDIVLDQLTEITIEKEKTVYYKYVAEKSGMMVVYSETKDNNIYFYNTTTYATSSYTNGAVCEYIYANEGDEIMAYVSSNGTKNYNKVEFTISQYDATENNPIPLYLPSTTLNISAGKSLTFTVTCENESTLKIEGNNIKLTVGGEDVALGEQITFSGTKVFTITNTSIDEKQAITISYNTTEQSE